MTADFLLSVAQAIAKGLLTGMVYGLMALGLSVIFGVMRIVNFAHGTFLMLGMYATYVLYDRLGINPYIGFIFAAVVLFVIGVVVFAMLRRAYRRADAAGVPVVVSAPDSAPMMYAPSMGSGPARKRFSRVFV